MSFRRINFNHVDKSLCKHKMDETTSLYKLYHEKFWRYGKPTRGSKTFYVMQFIINPFNSSWYCSWRGNNESHHIGHYTRFWVDIKNTEMKDFRKKIELCQYACTTYEKKLIKLRSFMRGVTFDNEIYLDQLKTG